MRHVTKSITTTAIGGLLLAALAVPGIGGASTSSSGLTYQVSPIAIPAGHATSGFPYTPNQCVTLFGLACYTPVILHDAYQIPWTVNGSLAGTGTQVAIIDAYGSPTVQQDLNVYDQTFGLPATTVHVFYPEGKVTYNVHQAGWAEETSLDVQTVHDLAPGAKINLVVASSPGGNDINNAIAFAVNNHLGNVLSMSFGAPEAAIGGGGNNLQVQQAHAIFQQATSQGMSLFASSGDSGAGNGYTSPNALYPASDPQVVATGGTDLFVSGNGRYTWKSETVWIIAGLVVFITLTIMGVPFAALFALWVALVDFLPTIGGALAGIPTVLFAFGHTTGAGIVTFIVFLVYTQIENHILNPLIMGRTTRVSPLAVFVAVLVGAELGDWLAGLFGGFVGVLIAVPIAASLQVIVVDLRAREPDPEPPPA